jgi:helicase
MKDRFPENHGLSDEIISNEKLIFRDEDANPSLTDAQFAALEAGVGRGVSVLVTSPTSTGKTHIALWAIANGLKQNKNVIYLVTHRALAKQKFDDFKSILLADFLYNDPACLVFATGDGVENAAEDSVANPLDSPLLVATYEKYLALLSASGIPKDMSSTVIVCDEIQLIGDSNRGQQVEILLTLIRNAGYSQFVGLSAVLENTDASHIASWLKVVHVIQHVREKHLTYECWTEDKIYKVSSQNPENLTEQPISKTVETVELDTISIIKELSS